MVDIEKLKKLSQAADTYLNPRLTRDFTDAATPSVILELIAQLEQPSAPAGEPVAPYGYVVDWADIGEGAAQSLFHGRDAKSAMESSVRLAQQHGRTSNVTPLFTAPPTAEAIRNEVMKEVDKQLCEAYRVGMYGDEFDLLAAKNAVARALQSSPAPVGKEGWQPIETAPKDGSDILLFTPDGAIQGYWCHGYWEQYTIYCTYDAAGGPAFNSKPTHWMSLPAAPSADTKEGS